MAPLDQVHSRARMCKNCQRDVDILVNFTLENKRLTTTPYRVGHGKHSALEVEYVDSLSKKISPKLILTRGIRGFYVFYGRFLGKNTQIGPRGKK